MPGGSRPTPAAFVPRPQTAVVTLPAEIDAATAGLVEAALASALASAPAVLIADATQTVFCDSTGIGALVRAHHQAAAAGAQLRMVITTAPARRIFTLIGADQVLSVYPSLAAAQADGSPRPPPPPLAAPARDPGQEERA